MTALLLSITALISYTMGSLRTDIIASRFIFHRNLRAYSRDNIGITRFMNEYGWGGLLIVFAVEALKTAIPVIIGGLLLNIVGQKLMGRMFALFCVMMGTDFPILYQFKGERSLIVMIAGLTFVKPPMGVFTLVALAAVYFFTHYVSLSVLASSVFTLLLSFMLLDGAWVHRLLFACVVIVFIEYRKNIVRLIKKKEPKFTLRKDLSYIFDDSL